MTEGLRYEELHHEIYGGPVYAVYEEGREDGRYFKVLQGTFEKLDDAKERLDLLQGSGSIGTCIQKMPNLAEAEAVQRFGGGDLFGSYPDEDRINQREFEYDTGYMPTYR